MLGARDTDVNAESTNTSDIPEEIMAICVVDAMMVKRSQDTSEKKEEREPSVAGTPEDTESD